MYSLEIKAKTGNLYPLSIGDDVVLKNLENHWTTEDGDYVYAGITDNMMTFIRRLDDGRIDVCSTNATNLRNVNKSTLQIYSDEVGKGFYLPPEKLSDHPSYHDQKDKFRKYDSVLKISEERIN